jgi:hypothetical protein
VGARGSVAGGGRATIPVGGAIEVENAIIPGAHSADICCSMFATFFPANHPVGETMDHLQKTTHFGAGGRPRGHQMTSAVLDERSVAMSRTPLFTPASA